MDIEITKDGRSAVAGRSGSMFGVWIDERLVYVREDMLTDEEVRLYRCDELLENMWVDHLEDEAKEIAEEIERRKRRLAKLTEKGRKVLHGAYAKVDAIMRNEMNAAELTAKEAKELEDLYIRTMPFATLSPEEEGRGRAFIRETAERNVKEGKFKNMAEALRHYGLADEADELEGGSDA